MNIHLKKNISSQENVVVVAVVVVQHRYSRACSGGGSIDGPFSFGSAVGAHHHRASLQLKGLIE